MNFFITLLLVLFLNSCSHKNAFSDFSMDPNQELSATSLKRTKIVKDTKIIGAFNAIYLNKVYPDIYNGNEYFFVYIYLKNAETISNPNIQNNDTLSLLLNDKQPLKLKKINSDNRFYKLSGSKNNWSRYYLVSFDRSGKSLRLKLKNSQSFSALLSYQKDH